MNGRSETILTEERATGVKREPGAGATMPAMFSLVLPEEGLLAVRRASTQLDDADLREHGVDAARVYFAGVELLMRLEGEGDVLAKMRNSRTGGAFLAKADAHAWFDRLAQRLDPLVEAGEPRGHGALTGVAALPVNAGHEAALHRELRDAAPSLSTGPRIEIYHGRSLVLWFAFNDVAEVDAVLQGPSGAELQRVLTAHTGFAIPAWREEFALDQVAVARGLMSSFNYAPAFDADAPKGTWGPMPPFRTPPGP
jgi:hypothetical protein